MILVVCAISVSKIKYSKVPLCHRLLTLLLCHLCRHQLLLYKCSLRLSVKVHELMNGHLLLQSPRNLGLYSRALAGHAVVRLVL